MNVSIIHRQKHIRYLASEFNQLWFSNSYLGNGVIFYDSTFVDDTKYVCEGKGSKKHFSEKKIRDSGKLDTGTVVQYIEDENIIVNTPFANQNPEFDISVRDTNIRFNVDDGVHDNGIDIAVFADEQDNLHFFRNEYLAMYIPNIKILHASSKCMQPTMFFSAVNAFKFAIFSLDITNFTDEMKKIVKESAEQILFLLNK